MLTYKKMKNSFPSVSVPVCCLEMWRLKYTEL
jgi:hypothetical protein